MAKRSNINSTSRDTLNGKTPYEATLLILDEETINKLGIVKIESNEVNLSPSLLKESDKLWNTKIFLDG